MLIGPRIVQALESRREAMRREADRGAAARAEFGKRWDQLRRMSRTELDLALGGVPWPGARPTEEFDRCGPIVPFGRTWAHAGEARAWALERLRGVYTAAVDGSQIGAAREFDVPVALVQVGWFENPHHPDRPYVKDLRDEILLPEGGDLLWAESRLNLRRYQVEMAVVGECLERAPKDPLPLVFHDGTLVLSFTGRMPPGVRRAYLGALFATLDRSERIRVPLVGYIDHSLAADLAAMLKEAFEVPSVPVPDAAILADRMQVFDRTATFLCARGDILPEYGGEDVDYSQSICFLYLKVGDDREPVRLDFPRWVLEAGLVDRMVDIVRAEIVAGAGYPYALETADATAVLTTEDRLAFYRLWREFADRNQVAGAAPAKAVSKGRRR